MTTTTTKAPENSTTGREMGLPMQLLGAGLREMGKLAPTATGDLITHLMTATWRPRRPLRENETLRSSLPFAVQLNGTRLHAMQWGEGPVVVLVHGWNGRGTQLGAFVEPLTRRGYRVVAFDAPGHGKTSGHRATLATFADALLAVGRAAGPVHAVIGHSAGAMAALLAQAVGLEAGRLILVSPPAGPRAWVSDLATQLRLDEAVRQRVMDRVEDHMARWPSIDATELARSLAEPVLLLHDRDDAHVPWERAREIADSARHATLVTTSGLGHHRILRDEAVVQRAVDFVDDLVPRSRS